MTIIHTSIGQQVEQYTSPSWFEANHWLIMLILSLIVAISFVTYLYKALRVKELVNMHSGKKALTVFGIFVGSALVSGVILGILSLGVGKLIDKVLPNTAADNLTAALEDDLYENYKVQSVSVDVDSYDETGITTFNAELMPESSNAIVETSIHYSDQDEFVVVVQRSDDNALIETREGSTANEVLGATAELQTPADDAEIEAREDVTAE